VIFALIEATSLYIPIVNLPADQPPAGFLLGPLMGSQKEQVKSDIFDILGTAVVVLSEENIPSNF
jgi:uncharacterized membrane protein